MKKIRIGNDVLIRTDLKGLSAEEQLRIKSLRCIITRTDFPLKADGLSVKYYEPSEYTYGCCGCNGYNVPVYNNGYGMLCTAGDPHWFPAYNGFGVCSPKFKYLCNEYSAAVKVFDNYVEAYMPANEQKVGTYKVVFIVTVYQDGWGIDNIKTITVDEGELFMLVDHSESGVYEDGVIDLTLLDIDSIIPCSENFQFEEIHTYKLGDKDCTEQTYQFEYTVNGSQNKYTINKDNANNFEFSIDGSIDNNISISEDGTLILQNKNQQHFDIIIKSKRNPEICAIVTCEVKEIGIEVTSIESIPVNAFGIDSTYMLNDYLSMKDRYGFKLNGTDELMTDKEASAFNFSISDYNNPSNDINSTIDENGTVSIKQESFDDIKIEVIYKKDPSISAYIRASVSTLQKVVPNYITPSVSIMNFKNGETIKLNNQNLAGQLYQFNWSSNNSPEVSIPIDKYSACRYFDFNVTSTKKDDTLSSIDEYGTVTTKTSDDDSDDIKITCTAKENKEVSGYINASVTVL